MKHDTPATLHGPSRWPAALLAVVLLGGCAATAPEGSTHAAQLDRLLRAPAWPAAATAEAPTLDLQRLEAAVHHYVNDVRERHGLPALAYAPSLHPIVQAHSRDMARQRYFGHVNLAGEDASVRARKHGLGAPCQRGMNIVEGVGENLFLTHHFAEYQVYRSAQEDATYRFIWKGTDEIAREVVARWMESPSHRANLLSPLYQAHAVGAAEGEGEAIFVTQNLLAYVPPTAPTFAVGGVEE